MLKTTKHCWRKLKKRLINGEDFLCLWIRSLNFGKIAVLSKQSTCAMQSLSSFLEEIEELILKYIWTSRGPKQPKQVWKKSLKNLKITKDSYRLISKLTTKLQKSKQCSTSIKNRHVDQWNGTESPEINTHICRNYFWQGC